VDFVVCTLAVEKRSGQISTCRIGPFTRERARSALTVIAETAAKLRSPWHAGVASAINLLGKLIPRIINQNLIQEEIRTRLNSGNACYRSVQNLLSYRLLSKIIKIRIYKSIFPLVLYICEIRSLILREKHRQRVFENRVLRRIFGPKRDEVTGDWRKLHNEELHDLYLPSVKNYYGTE
jgi:hypothetical protein